MFRIRACRVHRRQSVPKAVCVEAFQEAGHHVLYVAGAH